MEWQILSDDLRVALEACGSIVWVWHSFWVVACLWDGSDEVRDLCWSWCGLSLGPINLLGTIFHRSIHEHGGHSLWWGPQTTCHTHGSNGILNMFCAFKRAVKCSVELDRPYFTFFFCFLVLNFKQAACELCKALGHKISLKTKLKKKENTWMHASKSVFLIVMTQDCKSYFIFTHFHLLRCW